jgi:hypothetical protein
MKIWHIRFEEDADAIKAAKELGGNVSLGFGYGAVVVVESKTAPKGYEAEEFKNDSDDVGARTEGASDSGADTDSIAE